MTDNAIKLQKFLQNKNVNIKFEDSKGGSSFCNFFQGIKCGITIRILVIFDAENKLVSIYGLNYITVTDSLQKEDIYKLLNKINDEYTYIKFTMSNDTIDDNIVVSSFMMLDRNFNEDLVMSMIINVLTAMENEYARFMRLIQS